MNKVVIGTVSKDIYIVNDIKNILYGWYLGRNSADRPVLLKVYSIPNNTSHVRTFALNPVHTEDDQDFPLQNFNTKEYQILYKLDEKDFR